MDYRRGAKGDEVARIQTRLRELKLYRGPIDGDFGGGTESAVRVFQQDHGLTSDGIVGPTTWEVLYGADVPVLQTADGKELCRHRLTPEAVRRLS